MPYPNSTASVIVISQTSGSSIGGQYPFIERQISGSNLFLVTDANGDLTGSTSIPGGSFTNLTVTGALTASIISSSTAITAAAATFTGPVTMSSTLSASGGITASAIFDAGALTVSGTSTLGTTNITGLLSASGNISASNIYDAGTLTVVGTSTFGTVTATAITSALSGSSIATGNATLAGGTINGTSIGATAASTGNFTELTASSISSSGAIIASSFTGSFSGSIGNAVTASYANALNSANSYTITNLTASNISASGTISASVFSGAHTGSVFGTSSWATNALTAALATSINFTASNATFALTASIANALNSANSYQIANLTASGNIEVNGGTISTVAATLTLANTATTIAIGGATTTASHAGIIDVTDTTAATILGAGSIQTDGGVYVGKNLIVSGSATFYGDVTMFGTGSIINISSSNIIIGDNRIQLNAWSVGGPQRYGGLDIFDSGSSAAVTSSILWDSLNNYWLLQNNATGSPSVSSSAIILQGPTSSFGSEYLLTANNFLKVQTTNGNLITSSLSEVGNTLQYAGTISASVVSGSSVYGATGSFVNLNVFTGSSPGVGGVPATPTDNGMPGQIEIDNNFIYVYTNNLWKRVPISVWSA